MSKNSINSKNCKIIKDFFLSSSKSRDVSTIGLEIEHFIINTDTKDAISYDGETGVASIVLELSAFYPDAKIERGGPLLGFETDKFIISLGPACQFIISIFPTEDLGSIVDIYEVFIENLEEILTPLNYECVTLGYQPKSLASELKIIPNKRYEFMDEYFKTSGTFGMNMLKGTASTRVSIDFYNEDDFRKKFQASYVLSPYFKLLCDNSPIFEGKENTKKLMHTYIGDNVDSKRCGIIPDVMKPDFSFTDYAEYILNMPPIFIPKTITGSEDIYTSQMTVSEYLGEREMTSEELSHFLSMALFDIRLKSHIEICVADSIPSDLAFAYAALIKGIFYSNEALSYVTDLIKELKITENHIKSASNIANEKDWNAIIYGDLTFSDIHSKLVELSYNYLTETEKQYLNIYRETL